MSTKYTVLPIQVSNRFYSIFGILTFPPGSHKAIMKAVADRDSEEQDMLLMRHHVLLTVVRIDDEGKLGGIIQILQISTRTPMRYQ